MKNFKTLTIISICLVLSLFSCYRKGKLGENELVTLDTTFNYGQGKEYKFDKGYGFFSKDLVNISEVIVQPDGKILVAGKFEAYNNYACSNIVRLNANGTFDNSFKVTQKKFGEINSVALQKDGKIIIAGEPVHLKNQKTSSIIRVYPNGSLDRNFKVDTNINYIKSIALTSDEKIAVLYGLNTNRYALYSTSVNLKMLINNGESDYNFNNINIYKTGIKNLNIINNDEIICLVSSNENSSLIKLNKYGKIDNNFKKNVDSLLKEKSVNIESLLINKNGELLIGGDLIRHFNSSVLRLNRMGKLDTTFNLTGLDTLCLPDKKINSKDSKYLKVKRLSYLEPLKGYDGIIFNKTFQTPITQLEELQNGNIGFVNGYSNGGCYFGGGSFIYAGIVSPEGTLICELTKDKVRLKMIKKYLNSGFLTIEQTNENFNRILKYKSNNTLDSSFIGNFPIGASIEANEITKVVSKNSTSIFGYRNSTYNERLFYNNNKTSGAPLLLNKNGNLVELKSEFYFDKLISNDIGDSIIILISDSIKYFTFKENEFIQLKSFLFKHNYLNNYSLKYKLDSKKRIIFTGSYNKSYDTLINVLVRYNSNGQVDSSFIPAFKPDSVIIGFTLQPDNKLIILYKNGKVVRLLKNGKIDPLFLCPYKLLSDNWKSEVPIIVNKNGEIVIFHSKITCLNSDGSLNKTFNNNHIYDGPINSALLLKNGNILVGGSFSVFNNKPIKGMVIISSSGKLLFPIVPNDGFNGDVLNMLLQPHGNVIVGGCFSKFGNFSTPNICSINIR